MLMDLPEEFVEISMLHILKDHDEWITLNTDTIEFDNVLMLQVSQKFCLTVEVLAGIITGIFQCLVEKMKMKDRCSQKVGNMWDSPVRVR